ncbi:MAG: 3-phytase [Acidimicrobiales bacterium]|nr:3-phytase [Acidimicrobiales bacterium]
MVATAFVVAVAVAVVVALTRSGERSVVGVVEASAETAPVRHGGDAADDPAVWVDRDDPRRSTVIGTDKQGGLGVYDLAGREVQFLAGGNPNNVDLRDGFPLGGRTVTLVAAGDRSDDTIAVYAVDERTRRLRDVAAGPLRLGIEVYGSCLYRSAGSGRLSFIGTSEAGEVEQWELRDDGGRVAARRVRSFGLGSQTEGCVADDEHGALYLAEEAVGVWRYGAEPADGDRRTRVAFARRDVPLVPDVEGLAVAAGRDGGGFLVASSQGDDSFAVFERDGENAYVGSFRVGDVESTDGLEVTTTPLGAAFPQGVLVVQDGDNGDEHQNFKLVPWGDVADLLGRP